MYFPKKYWLLIRYIYMRQKISLKSIYILKNDLNVYLPKIFFFVNIIIINTGNKLKFLKNIKINKLVKYYK